MSNNKTLPKGTVTLLFADVEGSTRLLGLLGKKYTTLLSEMRQIVRESFKAWNGIEVGTEGDSFFAAFQRATDCVESAVAIQRSFTSHKWPDSFSVKIRIGIHTGEPWVEKEDYVGIDVHRAARISNLGHGGQVLLSETTSALIRDELPSGIRMTNLGWFRLKDFQKPENIHQLVIPDLPSEFPPLKSSPAQFTEMDRDNSFLPEILNQKINSYTKPGLPPSVVYSSKKKQSDSQLQIISLGGLSFRRGIELVEGFTSLKEKALLVYLVYNQKPYSLEQLAKFFWENRGMAEAISNLKLTLKNLEKCNMDCTDITADTVRINPHTRIWFDVFEFEDHIQKGDIEEALELYQGDFLAGFNIRGSSGFQNWTFIKRDHIRLLAQDMFDNFFNQCISEKEFKNCINIINRMLDLDPLNENNHRRMISLKAYLGHVEEAFQQYEILSNILQNELGKEPSVETLRLINRIRDENFNQDDISLFYTTK